MIVPNDKSRADLKEIRREFVYRKLKNDLVNCRFHPGQHLSIAELSATLRVSNTPIREALIRLTGERLVFLNPTHGFFARKLLIGEMEELIELIQFLLVHSIDRKGRPFPSDQVWRPTILSLQSKRRVSRVLRKMPKDTVTMMESLFLAIASMSTSETIIDIVRNICDRTHQICIWEAQQHRKGCSLATELIDLLAVMDAGDVEKGRELISTCLQRLKNGLKESVPMGLASLLVKADHYASTL